MIVRYTQLAFFCKYGQFPVVGFELVYHDLRQAHMVHHWPLIWYCTVLINLSLTALKLIKVPSRSLSVKTQSRHEYFPELRDIYIKHRIPKIVPSKQLHKDLLSLLLAMIGCDIYVQ